MKTIITVMLTLSLVGCNTFSKDHSLAQSGQWLELGRLDGLYGYQERGQAELSELGQLEDDALSLYQTGFTQGINEFCTPDNAFLPG